MEALRHYGLVSSPARPLPRSLRSAPQLAVVAHFRQQEVSSNEHPGRDDVERWFRLYGDESLGAELANKTHGDLEP